MENLTFKQLVVEVWVLHKKKVIFGVAVAAILLFAIFN